MTGVEVRCKKIYCIYSELAFSFFGQELKKDMQELLQRINGLIAVVITDRDGVPIVKGKFIIASIYL